MVIVLDHSLILLLGRYSYVAFLDRNQLLLSELINNYHIYTARMSPALNESSALECFECSNAIELRNEIMFDFYPGLPHMYAKPDTGDMD